MPNLYQEIAATNYMGIHQFTRLGPKFCLTQNVIKNLHTHSAKQIAQNHTLSETRL